MDALPDDLDPLEESLLDRVARSTLPPVSSGGVLDPMTVATLLEAQVTSRLLDHTARWLRSERGAGYYTIGSAGHEANAIVALASRPTDPALLHYRSGGFYTARSMQARHDGIATTDPIRDVLRGMLARTTDPIAGGRHKVFGSEPLSIIPQTSTIASHLPRAVGLALSFSLDGVGTGRHRWPDDSVVVCSFGDASLNHSTAQGALNWAAFERHRGRRVPILFVCEDNGLGLSVPSPADWVRASTGARPGLRVARANGADPAATSAVVGELIDAARVDGSPAFLHLDTVRFLGHAGSDVEGAYREPGEIAADRERDPLLGTVRLAIETGATSPGEFVEWYLDLRSSIRALALEVRDEPEQSSADAIAAPLRLDPTLAAATTTTTTIDFDTESTTTSNPTGEGGTPLTLGRTINRVLSDLLDSDRSAMVFGEDVGRKGGVYGVTRGLQQRFGEERVFDTLLDEQSILGLALGSALNGYLPIPEIQYLAYLHNAEDQLRGEAASLAYFSEGRYLNPMVVRIASYAYQKGFGGHFHNDNSVAVLRDIPGIVIASPSHPRDAAGMFTSCVAAARSSGAVCVVLEPIARYHEGDLHEVGDEGWLAPYDATAIEIGRARTWGGGDDLTIITWGNGLYLSLRAQRELRDRHGVGARVVDLRWLAPLPVGDMVDAAEAAGRVLVVDETRRSGGVGEGVVSELLAAGFTGHLDRVAAVDTFVPLGDAANLVLVSESDIVRHSLTLARRD